MKQIVELLKSKNRTISTMESCTGGCLVNEITNIEGSSDIIKFSAIVYANEFKIKMGVSSELIDKYSVYSKEVAMDMSKKITLFTSSDYGVGITGKLNRVDKNNMYGDDNIVYLSIYDKEKDKYFTDTIEVNKNNRLDNKEIVVSKVKELLLIVLK